MDPSNNDEQRRSRSRSPLGGNILDILGDSNNIPSRRVPGVRGGLVYLDGHGYTYVQNHTSTNRRQLRCTRYERGCHATASMALEPENDPIIMYSGHNHRPGHDVEIGNFLATLRSRAAAESTPPRIIYEEESRRFPNAATEMSVDVALRMMRNIRQRFNPTVPASLAAMGETIASQEWRGRLMSLLDDNNNNAFFQGSLEYLIGTESIFGGLVFANLQFLQNYAPFMRQSKVVAVDGTFGVLPRSPSDMDQLVTIHVLLDNISIPVVYAILNQRTENIYARLWQFLKNDLPFSFLNWNNLQVITDYETALRNAIRRVVPECQLVGCWFHFNQCIVRYIQTHNLMQLVRNNQYIATIVRMLMALPHLPAERREELPPNFNTRGGFLEIQRLARSMSVDHHIMDLFRYVQNYWLDTIGPVGFSVFGYSIRTNNYLESFHSMIQTTIGQHPPLWTFYDRLRSVERRVRRETQQLINGHQVRRSVLTSRDTNNKLLEGAYQNVRNGRFDVSAFLRRVAYSARGYCDEQIGPIPMDNQLDQNMGQLVMMPLQPPPPLPGRIGNQVRRPRGVVRDMGLQPRGIAAIPNIRGRRCRGRQANRIGRPNNQQINLRFQPAEEIEGIEENIVVETSENIVREESENAEILVVAIPQMPGEEYDRCFVCLSGRNEDIGSVNILLPCGHGWCCDNCGQQQTNCGICKTPIDDTFSIYIMIGNGQWMNNLNSLLDPTGSNCLCCLRAFRDVPNGIRYVYQSCGHGWRCEDCAFLRPDNCEVCDNTVDDVIQIFIC